MTEIIATLVVWLIIDYVIERIAEWADCVDTDVGIGGGDDGG